MSVFDDFDGYEPYEDEAYNIYKERQRDEDRAIEDAYYEQEDQHLDTEYEYGFEPNYYNDHGNDFQE